MDTGLRRYSEETAVPDGAKMADLPGSSGRGSRRVAFWCEAGLDLAALGLLPLLVLAPRGAAALAAFTGLCGGGLLLARRATPPLSGLAVPTAVLGGLVLLGAFSAAWAPEPRHSLGLAGRLGLLFVAGLLVAASGERIARPDRSTRCLVIGLVVAAVLAATDLASRGALTRLVSTRPYQPAWLNQAANGITILLLPCAAALACGGRRFAALLLAVAGAATVLALAGSAAKLALAAGLIVAALYRLVGRPLAGAAALASVLAIATAPLTFARLERLPLFPQFAERVKQSAEHRLQIWSFVGDRIAERPVFGWGLDASRAIPGGRQPIRHGETWLPLHPHNAPLQLWLELGVPGAALGSLLAAFAWRALAASRWPPLYAAAAAGSLAAVSVASLGTYGIWQEWWLATLLLAFFLVRVMARGVPPSD